MGTSCLEKKIINLETRLNSEKTKYADSLKKNSACSHRPKIHIRTPTKTRKRLDLPVNELMQPKSQDNSEMERKMKEIMKMNGILNINGKRYITDIKDLEHLGELGNGTCGHVVKMLHKPGNTVIAVKQMRRSGNRDENKRIIMDLDVVFKSLDCPYIVRYLGSFITESDVWICMELMATCFDRLLKKLRCAIAEDILGKVTVATVKALHYLKESHGIIHRDVKPSNILLDEKGNIKLCDFGISGRLVDSKAKTKNAGCAAYMAPERIEPPDPRRPDYDIRADVWSLGITLVELATGAFPYKDCKCDFEVLSRVLNEDPPTLPEDPSRFSTEFRSFVSSCLTKNYEHRPKYNTLLQHPFLKKYEAKHVDVAAWYSEAISNTANNTALRFFSTSFSSSTRRQPPPSAPLHQSRFTGLENIVLNGDQSRKYSSLRSSQYIDELQSNNNWDAYKHNSGKYICSSLILRKCYPQEVSYSTNSNSGNNNHTNLRKDTNGHSDSENTSPLVLKHLYYQPNRSSSVSPSRKNSSESLKIEEESRPSSENIFDRTQKKVSSYLQFNSSITDDQRQISSVLSSTAPPSPPPRLNKSVISSSSGSDSSSSLIWKRNYYNNSSNNY